MILSARTTGQCWCLNFGPSFKTIYDEHNKNNDRLDFAVSHSKGSES